MFQDIYTIFSKEFASYFRTRLAYFILLVYALVSFSSAFYGAGFFELPNSSLFSFFYFQPEIFIILIPALTMKLWADEYRYGTAELLLSQPIGYLSMVLGKFFAAWVFCLLMLVVSLPLWLSAAQIIDLDNLNIASSYLACILVSAALCAIGAMVSAFNTSPVAAYLLSLAAIMFIKLVNFDTLFKSAGIRGDFWLRISRSLSFDNHYNNLISGQLFTSDLVYFLSLTIFALWLNTAAVSYKRS